VREPYKTPLYFSFPSTALCDLLISAGADPYQLSFLHCYFTYRKQAQRQEDLFKFVYNLVVKHRLDCNETDIGGRNCVAIVYQDLRDDPGSVEATVKQNMQELHFLASIGSNLDHKCMDNPSQGRTILLDAAYKGRVELFSYLLTVGANPDTRCIRGKTLSDYIRMDFEETLRDGSHFIKSEYVKN